MTLALRERIITGDLRPGSMIVEPVIAAEFGVSKTPVREALQRLSVDGLVSVLPKRGYLVRALNQEDLAEVSELRRALEPLVASHLAADVSRDAEAAAPWLAELERVVRSEESRAPGARVEPSEDFHLHLIGACQQERLVGPLRRAINESLRAQHLMPELPLDPDPATTAAEHRSTLTAIAAGDPNAAELAAREHLSRLTATQPHL